MSDRPPHVIVLPGGGYSGHAGHEGEPAAEWLRGLGLDASVLRYPVKTRHPGPIDAVRARVAELRGEGVQRLGVLGFSAGGHLAAHAATEGLVDAAILGYPVISMMTPTHAGSQLNLLGRWPMPWKRRALSIEHRVTPLTPPLFIWHTAADDGVPVYHSYRLGLALERHGVPHAMHVYPQGRHGLGLVEECRQVSAAEVATAGIARHWTRDCAEWLTELGWID